VDTARNQFIQPRFRQQFVNVGLADAGGDAGKQSRPQRSVEAAHGAVENLLFSAALVAGDFPAFDRDKRSGVSNVCEFTGNLVRNELAICEYLKVTVRMLSQQLHHFRVHERFTAKYAEEAVSMFLRIKDCAIERIEIDLRSVRLDIHPAALAPQIARVDNGKIKKWRKELTPLDSSLEFFD
jgi:hypothetical protein